MNKKFLAGVAGLTLVGLVIAFTSHGLNDNPRTKYSKILRNAALVFEQGHVSPKKIDDTYSSQVFNLYLENLDDDKTIFLATDIAEFKKYEKDLDDELKGKEIKSFFTIQEVYKKRLVEVNAYLPIIFNKPFDFSKDETISFNEDKMSYAQTELARFDHWRKRFKYLVLSRFVEAQNDRDKNKGKKDFVAKADSTLEREAREAVKKQYTRFFTTKINKENTDFLFGQFVNAYAETMDPHSNYFPPVETRGFQEEMSGTFFGIGAQLKEDDGKIKIASLVTGGPAWKQGDLKAEDEVIKVAQGDELAVDVTGYSVTDAVKLIRGAKKGSIVKLTVKRADGNIKIIAIERDKVELEDTFAKSAVVKDGDKKVGYIYLPEFYTKGENGGHSCSDDIALEVKKLKEDQVSSIVIDLRNNGGGSLQEVVDMVGLFIDLGPVVQVKGKEDAAVVLSDRKKGILYDGPLSVMINEYSASASEIFAAAIQDYKRGVIIGNNTFGKGTVQRMVPLTPVNKFFGANDEEDLGAVKLTIQKFYRVNGGTTQLRGVAPDITFPSRNEFSKIAERYYKFYLPYDEIPKANYAQFGLIGDSTTWRTQFQPSESSVKIAQLFTTLKEENNKDMSLNISKFKLANSKMKDIYKDLEEVTKLKNDLVVESNVADKMSIEGSKEKQEKATKWLALVAKDYYLAETIKAMKSIYSQNNKLAIK